MIFRRFACFMACTLMLTQSGVALAEPSTKEDKKTEAKNADDKKAKKGLFGGKTEKSDKPEKDKKNKADKNEKAEKSDKADKTGKTEVVEKAESKKVEFEPDAALISVLKDLNRTLLDAEAVTSIQDANEKYVVGLGRDLLAQALKDGKLQANRIVDAQDENRVEKAITTEAWSSGEIVVSPEFKGSLSAVWAKRIGGLLTLTLAGDCRDRKAPDGSPIGEFLVIMQARSPVEKGFDIQSQTDVKFWLGKLQSVAVESSCIKKAEEEAKDAEKKSQGRTFLKKAKGNNNNDINLILPAHKRQIPALPPLLTQRYRTYMDLVAQKTAEEKKAEEEKAAKALEEQKQRLAEEKEREKNEERERRLAEAMVERRMKQQAEEEEKALEEKERKQMAAADKDEDTDKEIAEKQTEKQAAKPQEKQVAVQTIEEKAGPRIQARPSYLTDARQEAKLCMPDRALAGHSLTVALLGEDKVGERNVELSFNGASYITDEKGQAIFNIPDDLLPGRSLNISITCRAGEMPMTVDILHPLNLPDDSEAPRLDRATPLTSQNTIMVLDGHNFDGVAANNAVIIDGGAQEANVIAASPVQLKVLLSQPLTAGVHTMCVNTQGKRSNPIGFEFATAEIQMDGKERDNGRLVVKVRGTHSKVNLRVKNKSPETVKLSRGPEATGTSSGGSDNSLVLNMQRLKKGPIKMEALLEL
jgi:hypothetical protein